MRGCHDDQIPSYLDDFMWFERYGTTPQQAWIGIIQDIAQ